MLICVPSELKLINVSFSDVIFPVNDIPSLRTISTLPSLLFLAAGILSLIGASGDLFYSGKEDKT